MAISFRLLGPLEVRANGQSLALGPPKQRAVLVALLVRAGEAIPIEQLVDELWPEDPPASARHAVQVYVSRLRRALEEAGEQGRIETHSRAYALCVHQEELDLARFRALTDEGRARLQVEPGAAAERLREALALWRGRALSDLDDESGVREVVLTLDEERLEALELRIEADLAHGRDAELIPELERLIAEQPAREIFYAQLMLALYRAGRQAEALEAYQRARRVLVRELGLEPGPRLRGLQAAILRQDASLTLEPPELRTRRHLPAQPNALIGRAREVAEVTELMASGGVRLLTLTGPGGVGKTRLAIAAAERLASSFRDGVWFVPLAPVASGELIPAAIAGTLGLAEQPHRPLADVLADYLRDRELLLVVDTVEHVVEGARTLAELLRAAPRLKLLATSRVLLDLYGEHRYDVQPLEMPTGYETSIDELSSRDAVALFVDRARAARRDFALTRSNGKLVARLCTAVDGLPLALELAAARLRTLELGELVTRLSGRLDLLGGGPRDAPDRQRTLRRAIRWSYDLLEPELRSGLARLGVFAAPFPVEAAAAISGTDRAVLDTLAERSLVRRHETGRYSLLDTIRDFALEQLTASESREARARHAAHYAALVRRLSEEGGGFAAMERELPEIRSALEYFRSQGDLDAYGHLVLDVVPVAERHGYVAEGLEWLAPALEGADALDPARRSKLLLSAALLNALRSDFESAAALGDDALEAAREAGDPETEAQVLANGSWFALERGQHGKAQRLARRGVEVAERVGDPNGRYASQVALSLVLQRADRIEEARRVGEDAVPVARTLSDRGWVSLALANLAHFDVLVGRIDDAVQHSTEALDFTDGSPQRRSMAVANLAFAQLFAGRFAVAAKLLHESMAYFERVGDLHFLGEVGQGVAAAMAANRRYREAAVLTGVSNALQHYGRSQPYATEKAFREAFLDPARTALGHSEWDRLEASGRRLPQEQAIELAVTSAARLAERARAGERLLG